jgi:hypothetical protein
MLLLGASDVKEPKRGAYCPLPEPGSTPECLVGAQAEYSEFFAGLEGAALSDEAAARLETDVAQGAGAARPYEALSSLAYGYLMLAQRASASDHLDPATAARLQRWNELLANAFEASGDDPHFQAAVRTAAVDIRAHAPPVGLECLDAEGNTSKCDSTEAVLRGFGAAREQVGVRGQIGRLFERLFGDDGSQ